MAYIQMNQVEKRFRINRRPKGICGAFKSMLHREYEWKHAVNGISFSIDQGELVGYIGPNGAGKSTTIKMLCGILVPDSGTVLTGGIVPWKNRKQNARKIGVVFGQRSQLNWDLPLEDTFQLYQRMYQIPQEHYHKNLTFFVELLNMGDFLRKPVRQLSLGQKMRAEIAVALLHNPEILYLDEPTIGLDVVAKDTIRQFIRELNREKKTTVILTTHDMTDMESICSRVMMINHGALVLDETMEQFQKRGTNQYNIQVTFRQILKEDSINEWNGMVCVEKQDHRRGYQVFPEQISIHKVLQIITECCEVTDIRIQRADIDEIVRRLYQRQQEG